MDQDEEWEYTHLLAESGESRPHADFQWVTFGGNASPTTSAPGEERRGSVSTQDSDLDPKRVVHPADDLALFGSTIVPTRKSAVSVLSLPSRPRRAAQHLRKPDYLVDVPFSWSHASPKSPRSPTSSAGIMKPKGKARRRPAPLKLSPPSLAIKRPSNSPFDADKVRKDFLAASFEPLVPVTPATAVSLATPVDVGTRLVGNSRAINVPRRTVNDGLTSLGMKTKPSMLNMMGFFRSARKEDVMC